MAVNQTDTIVRPRAAPPESHCARGLPECHTSKLRLAPTSYQVGTGQHRSGWPYALRSLSALFSDEGMLFDDFVERSFSYAPISAPYQEPWIGIFHHPPRIPPWILNGDRPQNIFRRELWRKSKAHLKLAIALSHYHADILGNELAVATAVVTHPTETPPLEFNEDSMPKYCKVFPDQFAKFYGHQRFETVEEHLPFVKWIYLRRNDLASQTASFLLAKRSNVWNYHARDVRQATRLNRTSVQFPDDEVYGIARWLMQMDNAVSTFLRSRPHLAITYESLVQRRRRILSEVFTYIGITRLPPSPDETTVELRHPLKDELVQRVRQLIKDGTHNLG